MAGSLSPLHTALDLHQLDPSAKEDRPYLISLMRRMGYSDIEIADVVSGKKSLQQVDEERAEPEPEPVVETPAVQVAAVDAAAPRLIELEYGGAEEIPAFEPVHPKVHPATEYEVKETEEEPEDNEFTLLVPEQRMVDFTEAEEELVEFTDADSDDDFDDVDPLYEEPLQDAPSGHEHKGFTLYRRELAGGQHVYFYSKKQPADADPAEIPDGYAVQESEDSGLPFLARQ